MNRRDEIKKYITENPEFRNGNYNYVAKLFDTSYETIRHVARELRNNFKVPLAKEELLSPFRNIIKDIKSERHSVKPTILIAKNVFDPESAIKFPSNIKQERIDKILAILNFEDEKEETILQDLPEVFRNGNKDNILVIGDLHAPWIVDGYLEFCRNLQEKYNCGTIVFIGDLIDSHSWSFHTHNPDGLSVNDELERAIKALQPYYQVFPEAICLFGNHDLLVARKAMEAGLSKRFIKDFNNIINAPDTWEFKHEHIQNNVKYIHGSIGNAIKRAKDERISIVQGHLHSQAFIEYAVSERDVIFGLQIGCGIDRTSYAFEYAQPMAKKPVISAGVVIEDGTLPILELMKL